MQKVRVDERQDQSHEMKDPSLSGKQTYRMKSGTGTGSEPYYYLYACTSPSLSFSLTLSSPPVKSVDNVL